MQLYCEATFVGLTVTLYLSVERGFVVREAFSNGEYDEVPFRDAPSAVDWFSTLVAENAVQVNLDALALATD